MPFSGVAWFNALEAEGVTAELGSGPWRMLRKMADLASGTRGSRWGWCDTTAEKLAWFIRPKGKPVHPKTIERWWRELERDGLLRWEDERLMLPPVDEVIAYQEAPLFAVENLSARSAGAPDWSAGAPDWSAGAPTPHIERARADSPEGRACSSRGVAAAERCAPAEAEPEPASPGAPGESEPGLADALERAGIGGAAAYLPAEIPGLTPAVVERSMADVSPRAGPGARVAHIRARAPTVLKRVEFERRERAARAGEREREVREAQAVMGRLPPEQREAVKSQFFSQYGRSYRPADRAALERCGPADAPLVWCLRSLAERVLARMNREGGAA